MHIIYIYIHKCKSKFTHNTSYQIMYSAESIHSYTHTCLFYFFNFKEILDLDFIVLYLKLIRAFKRQIAQFSSL